MVDNSPRTIAVSHVLHRLLMPRHPPCALKHLTTTRCSHPLCNTQHTTTPQPPNDHHHPHREALDGPGREQPENHTEHGVSSGPNSVPSLAALRREPRAVSFSMNWYFVFHPATPGPRRPPTGPAGVGADCVKGDRPPAGQTHERRFNLTNR